MNIEIYLEDQKLDMENISLTDFNEELQISKYLLSQTELDFSSIRYLVGDKNMLDKSFQHQLKESLG
jgi:hypothetical protein